MQNLASSIKFCSYQKDFNNTTHVKKRCDNNTHACCSFLSLVGSINTTFDLLIVHDLPLFADFLSTKLWLLQAGQSCPFWCSCPWSPARPRTVAFRPCSCSGTRCPIRGTTIILWHWPRQTSCPMALIFRTVRRAGFAMEPQLLIMQVELSKSLLNKYLLIS